MTIKLSVLPPCIVIAFALPTVIFSLLESNNKFVDLISSASIVKPPILPPVNRTVEPVICPLFFNIRLSFELLIVVALIPYPPTVPATAFNTPAFVTLKGANAKVLLPNWIPSSASATNKSVEAASPNVIRLPEASISKFVAVKLLPLIVNPAICPLVAVIFPWIWASEAVICPDDFKIKLSLVELIWVDDNSKPPIVPPVNNTCEPVILPLDFNLKLLLLDLISELSKTNPPIVPVPVTSIFPSNKADDPVMSPFCLTFQLELEINI